MGRWDNPLGLEFENIVYLKLPQNLLRTQQWITSGEEEFLLVLIFSKMIFVGSCLCQVYINLKKKERWIEDYRSSIPCVYGKSETYSCISHLMLVSKTRAIHGFESLSLPSFAWKRLSLPSFAWEFSYLRETWIKIIAILSSGSRG